MQLYLPERHEALTTQKWSETTAETTIREIVDLSLEAFNGDNLWPVHSNLNEEYHLTKPITGLWLGAAGSMWALEHLTASRDKFLPYLDSLDDKHAESIAEFDSKFEMHPDAPGYLIGLSGIHLLRWKLSRDDSILPILEKLIKQNTQNPMNELMWAAPGTMLCALYLFRETQDQRWLGLYQRGVEYLFSTWALLAEQNYYAWIQHMYGASEVYLGLVHGFVGNMFALLKGFNYLTDKQKNLLIERTQDALFKTAISDERFANWLPCVGNPWPGAQDPMLQLCHGAPATIIGAADLWPYAGAQFKGLLLKAGELIWHAGPLKKPWGLCHGTAGNGYAFLKLYKATGDQLWLDRARQFAMHAIEQYQAMKERYDEIRTDSWCGDLGLALYLQDCIEGNDQFPMMDYFL